jgi:hypothetical protein
VIDQENAPTATGDCNLNVHLRLFSINHMNNRQNDGARGIETLLEVVPVHASPRYRRF